MPALHHEQRSTWRESLTVAAGVSKLLDHVGEWHRDRLLVVGNEGPGLLTVSVKSRTDRTTEEVIYQVPPNGAAKLRVQGAVEVAGTASTSTLTWWAHVVELEGRVEHAPPVNHTQALASVGPAGAFTDMKFLPPERAWLWLGWDGTGAGVDVRFVDAAGNVWAQWRLPAVPSAPILHPPGLLLQARNVEPIVSANTCNIVATWK